MHRCIVTTLFIAASFWFKESPCAVRTNTARLGRLCKLFVLSTLLVCEHMLVLCSVCSTMATTKHCYYGARRSILSMPTQIGWKTCFSSDFRNRTWIEPKPNNRRMPAEGKTWPLPLSRRTPTRCINCILSVILCSLWTMCTTIYLVHG